MSMGSGAAWSLQQLEQARRTIQELEATIARERAMYEATLKCVQEFIDYLNTVVPREVRNEHVYQEFVEQLRSN